jgi:signal transduction histidine kinase
MATALHATVYLATSIAARLRWRESQIVAMSRRARRNAEELKVTCKRLAEAEKMKSAYTRKVAHEMRSPLAAIENLLRVVSDGLAGDLSEQAHNTRERARTGPRGLLATVGDLLTLAAARDPRHRCEPADVDICNTLGSVVSLLTPQAEARKITIVTHVSEFVPCLRGDPEGMEQVLTNLISNAVKYSPDGSTVQVRVSCNSYEVSLEVSDTGIGIDGKDVEKVFDEFYRTSAARSVTPEGTGLGLSIVKSIVEAHGGTVELESQLGVGTKFTVRLPASKPTDISAMV